LALILALEPIGRHDLLMEKRDGLVVTTTAALAWYSRHLGDWVFIVHAALAFSVGYVVHLIGPSIEFPILLVVGIGSSGLVYYVIKRFARAYCTTTIDRFSRDFKRAPAFQSKTTERLVDAADVEILRTIRQARDIEGDHINLIGKISDWFSTEELLVHLGKLRALNYVRLDKAHITVTPEGLELLAMPAVAFQARVPSEIAANIAGMKLALNEGNLNEVVDGANRLFERILRRAFEAAFPSSYESEWAKLKAENKVKMPYERASLGELRAAGENLGFLKSGSVYENLLLAYMKIRVPQKHDAGESASSESIALTTMNLVESFVRLWYQPSHAESGQ